MKSLEEGDDPKQIAKILGIDEDEFKTVSYAFQELDADKDGILNRQDLAAALGEDPRDNKVNMALNALAIQDYDYVDIRAFAIALRHFLHRGGSKEFPQERAKFCYPMHQAQFPHTCMCEEMFVNLVQSNPDRFATMLSLREQLRNIVIGAYTGAVAVRGGHAERQLLVGGKSDKPLAEGVFVQGWGDVTERERGTSTEFEKFPSRVHTPAAPGGPNEPFSPSLSGHSGEVGGRIDSPTPFHIAQAQRQMSAWSSASSVGRHTDTSESVDFNLNEDEASIINSIDHLKVRLGQLEQLEELRSNKRGHAAARAAEDKAGVAVLDSLAEADSENNSPMPSVKLGKVILSDIVAADRGSGSGNGSKGHTSDVEASSPAAAAAAKPRAKKQSEASEGNSLSTSREGKPTRPSLLQSVLADGPGSGHGSPLNAARVGIQEIRSMGVSEMGVMELSCGGLRQTTGTG
eukprot:CAMPEP_0173457350 /NCGR_PEP_ID=MMETSP1357-20121228/57562_1 /TAXON_ID=77926 /ORGANISM="Hemiselmis rufescens, Strain PCC563" /LENGTH=460 /DNA_ID=CAMNT_0014424651 /DNA_START=127 /DNA_END=1509 /DNA_ORIENTATION=+